MKLKVGDNYSEKFIITQDMVNKFAELSGDKNPLHIDKKSQPGLENILNQIVKETILKEMYNKNDYVRLSNVQIEISKMINYNVLNHLFILASSKKTHEEVNAITYSILKKITSELEKYKSESDHHYDYLTHKIGKFFSGDYELDFQEELIPPDGSPIGSDVYLHLSCESEL